MAFGPVNVPTSGDMTVEEILKYVEEQIATTGGNARIIPVSVVAETEGQTVFPIGLETFDAEKDSVLVQSGITSLFYGQDFTVDANNVVLFEGVPLGRMIGIYVLKNVKTIDGDDYFSGVNIAVGSLPLDRLEEEVALADHAHDEYESKHKQVVVTLPAAGWSGTAAPYTMTVAAAGVTETNYIIVSPEPVLENFRAVGECMVMMTGQDVDSATFTAFESKPTIDLVFNLLVGGE